MWVGRPQYVVVANRPMTTFGREVRVPISRAYQNLVGDTTRVMLRLKALFRARGIKTPGQGIYHNLEQRPQWRAQLEDPGSQLRAKHAPRRP